MSFEVEEMIVALMNSARYEEYGDILYSSTALTPPRLCVIKMGYLMEMHMHDV